MSSGKFTDLGKRSITAVILGVAAFGALWVGDYAWAGFVLLLLAAMACEWVALSRQFSWFWRSAGFLYLAVLAVIMIDLRIQPLFGPAALLVLIVTIILTDIGAYFTGRLIGGKKMAPNISPGKTWSGFCGGLAFGACGFIGALIARNYFTVFAGLDFNVSVFKAVVTSPPLLERGIGWGIFIGACLSLLAQLGDLSESWIKRKARVKDSGTLLPGHGGVLDRVDGFLLSVPVLWALLKL